MVRIGTHGATATALSLGLGVLAPAPALASPVDLFGYGARGAAMAGAVGASARGHAAVYYNPAGLGFDDQRTFALGFQHASFDLTLNGEPRAARTAPAAVVGFGVPLPFGGFLERRLTLGLGFVLPQNSVLIADIARPGDPSFTLLESRAQSVSLQGALGARLTDWLSVGLGFLALSELDGFISVAPNDAGRLGSQVRSQLVASYSLVAGVEVRPSEALGLSLTWRDESRADFVYPMEADLGDDFPLPVPRLDIRGTAQYDPAQAALEVSARPAPWLLLGGGVTWKRWSAFDNPIVYTAVPEGYPPQPEPGFEDTWVARLGGEGTWQVGPVTLQPRAGLAFEPTPAPEQTGLHNQLDNDRLVTAAGLGVAWKDLRLDLALQWHALSERTSVKDDALVTDPEANPGYPSVTHDGSVLFFAVELGVRL